MYIRFSLVIYSIIGLCITFVFGGTQTPRPDDLNNLVLGRFKIQNLQRAIHAQDYKVMADILNDPQMHSSFLTLDIQDALKSIQALDIPIPVKSNLY